MGQPQVTLISSAEDSGGSAEIAASTRLRALAALGLRNRGKPTRDKRCRSGSSLRNGKRHQSGSDDHSLEPQQRRTFRDAETVWPCMFPNCFKFYLSRVSLSNHKKKVHNAQPWPVEPFSLPKGMPHPLASQLVEVSYPADPHQHLPGVTMQLPTASTLYPYFPVVPSPSMMLPSRIPTQVDSW